MNKNKFQTLASAIIALWVMTLLFSNQVWAHCDGLDGPVVKAARKALDDENVNLVLIWVQQKYENEIKNAFQKTLIVRNLNPQAKELADMYFFETLVRLHRAGEGAPYTDLKPAGRDLGPAIPEADEAIEIGSAKNVLSTLENELHKGLHEHFQNLMAYRNYDKDDIKAGRDFVKAYVLFVHYVEGIYEATQKSSHVHSAESENKDAREH